MAVYFIQATRARPIKIGTSGDVPARIKQLEATYNRPLALLATMPGGRTEERAIHERFASLRFGRTEQFRPDPALLDFIGRPLFVSACPVVDAMPVVTVPVKIDGEVMYLAKIVAAFRGQTLSSYLNEVIREVAARDIDEAFAKRMARPGSDPTPPKR